MHFSRVKNPAFSLLEVIIAVAIFAVAISAMLGFLPSLTRQSMNSSDALNASRLSDALRVELQRMAAVGGFDALAGQTKVLTASPPDTCQLVASRDAARLHALSYQAPVIADQLNEDAQYFLIEAWSFPDAPLAFDPNGSVLALHVRVSWPYHVPGSPGAIPLTARDQVSFNLALNR